MRIEDSGIAGVHRVYPKRWDDARGTFYEGFRADLLSQALGHRFDVAQINYSVSRKNTLRGLHGVLIPPGQAKYVTCVRGALVDIAVDLRVGSPTFGRHERTVLAAGTGEAVHIAEGLGHGFLALEDDTCICYVVSSAYVPGTQFEVNPLDPELDLPWGAPAEPILSAKDTAAPLLQQALAAGLLPAWPAVDERSPT